jgi:hypothetical protein
MLEVWKYEEWHFRFCSRGNTTEPARDDHSRRLFRHRTVQRVAAETVEMGDSSRGQKKPDRMLNDFLRDRD